MTATDFVMPKLGLTMTEGTIARWGVAPGNRFAAGDIIVVVETDKIAYEVEAPAPGILHEVLVHEGNAAPVGTPIGRWDVGGVVSSPSLRAGGEAIQSDILRPWIASSATPPRNDESESDALGTGSPSISSDRERIVATPFARRLSREGDIDLRLVEGTGPRGRIKAADVTRTLEARKPATPTAAASVFPTGLPGSYIAGTEADLTRLLALNEAIKRDVPALRSELAHYVVLAASRALDRDAVWRGPFLIGLASGAEDGAAQSASMFAKDDCRSLSALIAHAEAAIDNSPPSRGTLWIDRAQEGISFFSADPPRGWSASLNIGSARKEFRPDAQGQPVLAVAASLVLSCRVGEFDPQSAQQLLSRIRTLLENPFPLLAS